MAFLILDAVIQLPTVHDKPASAADDLAAPTCYLLYLANPLTVDRRLPFPAQTSTTKTRQERKTHNFYILQLSLASLVCLSVFYIFYLVDYSLIYFLQANIRLFALDKIQVFTGWFRVH